MISIERYIRILAIKTENNEIIPLFDERIKYKDTEDYGGVITLNGSNKHYTPFECVYDLIDKKPDLGIELEYYPEKLPFNVGDIVLYEVSNRKMVERKIKDIIYSDYDSDVSKGSDVQTYYKNYFRDISFEDNTLYMVKYWQPIYVLDDDTKVKYEFKLFHKLVE